MTIKVKDTAFIKKLLLIAGPIIIQQLLLQTFGIIDTVMVRGIERGISGVGIANQLYTIGATVMFGVNVGIGLYIAQFFGEKNEHNIKKSFALLIILGVIVGAIFTVIGLVFTEPFLRIFTKDPDVIAPASQYLIIVSIGFIPNLLSFCFSIAYRNIQKTWVPLIVSITSALTNVLLNYFLIFGIWIFPELGIRGAAIATAVASFVAFFMHYIYAKASKQMFFPKLSHFKEALDASFSKNILKRVYPLVINEAFFAIGSALYIIIFNELGTDAYEGYRIAESVVSIMLVVGMAMGTAASSMIGEQLGINEVETAKRYGRNFIFIGIILALILGSFTSVLAKPLVNIFRTDQTAAAANIAVSLMYVFGLRVALRIFVVLFFSIFRAGGMSRFVMILDAGVMWLIGLPLALIGYHVLGIKDIAVLFLLLQIEPLVRIIIGFIEYFRFRWIQNVIHDI